MNDYWTRYCINKTQIGENPSTKKAKTILNSELKSSLDNSIPDDIKAKLYQNNLNRFLHTSKKQTEEQPIIDPIVLPATKKPKTKSQEDCCRVYT